MAILNIIRDLKGRWNNHFRNDMKNEINVDISILLQFALINFRTQKRKSTAKR